MAQYGVSFVAYFTAYDSAAGTYKTGDSANIALQWTKDGSDAATTNSCSEVDSTNSPGLYKVTITAAEATCTSGNLSGKSSTATTIIISSPSYLFDTYTTVLPVGTIPGYSIVDNGTVIVTNTDATHVQLRAAAAFADGELVGHTISITGGTGAGQSRIITAYASTNDIATVDTWTTTPDGTSTYIVYPTPPGSTTAPAPANVVQISGDATAADNAESFFDGTGYAGTNNVIPLVTTTSTVTALAGNAGIKKNTQLTAYPFLMTDSTNHAPATGLTVTATRSIDGAAFGACANAVTEVSNGWYKITLAAADLNGNTIALKFTATGADQANHTIVTGP